MSDSETGQSHNVVGQPKASILLVDDNPANLLVLRAVLEDLNSHLVEALSGEDALQQLESAEFAAVLLDVQMPGVNGFETAKLIRARERSRHVPLIFLTAYDSDEFPIAQAYSLGAVDYLVKPVLPEVLRAKVSQFIQLYLEKAQARQEADQLRMLIHGTTEYAIFLLDPHGNVASWNPGAERIKQYRADEIIGKNFSCFYPQESIDRGWPSHALKIARTEGRFEDEGWRVRRDGSAFWASVVITALHDEAGNLRGFSKTTRDMTERKRAEENARRLLQEEAARQAAEVHVGIIHEQRERLRVTLESIGDAVISTDAKGRITFVNPVAAKLTGWSQDQAHGELLLDIFNIVNEETRRPVENPAMRALQSGVIVGLSNYTVLIAKDGTECPIDDSAAPVRDDQGNVLGAVLIFRDITERRTSEKSLQTYAAEVAESDRRKSEFLAMLAHELRNPLAPIRNALQILRMTDRNEQMVISASEMMERQVNLMVRLVDDLLDISRVSRGKIDLRPERVELAPVINDAIEAASALMQSRNHELTVTIPPQPIYLNGDASRLTQVIGNLLNNACKFTPEGGRIWLTVERGDEQAAIRVRDSGIGIAADHLSQIFEMFVQVDTSLERSVSGLGIGLTLVKNLVEMHDGTVEAHSGGLGQGSEFIVRLPILLADEQSQPKPAREKAQSATARRILVVDDNRDSAATLAMLLKLSGHETHTVFDGMEAVETAANLRPDVILLDIGLPTLNGYDVARQIREQEWGQKMVLVALTGWGQEEDRRKSSEAGFNEHLVKPVRHADLMKLLAELLPG